MSERSAAADRPGSTEAADADEGPAVCSAKGCRALAAWRLLWRNPKIHEESRRKSWVACDDHREHLATFLEARGFLRDTVPLR